MRWPLVLASLLILTTTGLSSSDAESFEIVDSRANTTATLRFERNDIWLTDTITGRTDKYLRERRYDSRDGNFLGYLNQVSGSVLRLPASGQGEILRADLNDPSPQFRRTRESLRPRSQSPSLWDQRQSQPYDDRFNGPPQRFGGQNLGMYSVGSERLYSPYRYPQSVLVESKLIPDTPLTSVPVKLHNGGPGEIQMEILDLNNPSNDRSLRLRSGQSVNAEFARSAGGTLIETYQTYDIYGEPITRDLTRHIPPKVLYEIVVRTRELQSVAIDRTGKSPNPIEDANYHGRGIGRFALPPGDALQPGPIDVYRTALSRGNGFTVAPILASEKPVPGSGDPLEQAVLEAQQRALNARRGE